MNFFIPMRLLTILLLTKLLKTQAHVDNSNTALVSINTEISQLNHETHLQVPEFARSSAASLKKSDCGIFNIFSSIHSPECFIVLFAIKVLLVIEGVSFIGYMFDIYYVLPTDGMARNLVIKCFNELFTRYFFLAIPKLLLGFVLKCFLDCFCIPVVIYGSIARR